MLKKGWAVDDFVQKISNPASINLQFCNEREIHRKRMVFLKFKSCFLMKLLLFEQNAKFVQLLNKTDDFIQENLDTIFNDFKQ